MDTNIVNDKVLAIQQNIGLEREKTNIIASNLNNVSSKLDDMQAQIDAKAPIAGPSFTGDVGIGTTSPQSLLHLSSGTSGDCVLILEADTDNDNENDNPRIQFRQDGGLDLGAIAMGDNLSLIHI